MNIKEKLIEELKKENWIIDNYFCMDRVNAIADLMDISHIGTIDLKGTNNKYLGEIKDHPYYLENTYDTDLTQLFNSYLEEYQPDIWLRSVLAAIQMDLKVEKSVSDNEWYHVSSMNLYLYKHHKYRINYQEPKLVPEEVWDLLDDDYKYIAKNEDGNLMSYSNEPFTQCDYWQHDQGKICVCNALKCLKDAAIHDVHWKDSLCTRPSK